MPVRFFLEGYLGSLERTMQLPPNFNPRGGGKSNAHYLSLGGVSTRALEQYLTDHPGIKSVFLCLDNDQPGRDATAKIRSMLSDKGYIAVDMPPPYGKDWNQYLQNTIKQEKYHGRPKEAAISI